MQPFTRHIEHGSLVAAAVLVKCPHLPNRIYGFSTPQAAEVFKRAMREKPVRGVIELVPLPVPQKSQESEVVMSEPMSTDKPTQPNNPLAFPVAVSESDYSLGMTLQDYFAAKAVAGLMSNPQYFGARLNPREVAEGAYNIAAAMLAERERRAL